MSHLMSLWNSAVFQVTGHFLKNVSPSLTLHHLSSSRIELEIKLILKYWVSKYSSRARHPGPTKISVRFRYPPNSGTLRSLTWTFRVLKMEIGVRVSSSLFLLLLILAYTFNFLISNVKGKKWLYAHIISADK